MNQIYSNGLKFIFLGHSCFRVIHWETIITKVHSQTLMAMKSGCKMYTHKSYVTLEWPLMLPIGLRVFRGAHVKHVHPRKIVSSPSRTTIPLIRPHQCDSEGGHIRGVLLYKMHAL